MTNNIVTIKCNSTPYQLRSSVQIPEAAAHSTSAPASPTTSTRQIQLERLFRFPSATLASLSRTHSLNNSQIDLVWDNENNNLINLEENLDNETHQETLNNEETHDEIMAGLSAEQLQEIIDNLSSSNLGGADKPKSFSGNSKDAIRWFEEFEYIASANGWNEAKMLKKFGVYLTGPARDWYSNEVRGHNLDWV